MNKRLGVLQREQIAFGKNAGLSDKEIKLYAKPRYNFLQMQEMRLALEEGISSKQVKRKFKSSLSHEDMERLRKELKDLKEYEEPINEEKILLPYYLAIIAMVVITFIYVGISFFNITHKPYLEVLSDYIQIEKGSIINPLDYVEYSNNNEISYNNIDTNKPGEKVIVYKLKKGSDKVIKYMTVDIKEKSNDIFLSND